MSYFEKLRKRTLLSLSCLMNDIDFGINNRMKLTKHRRSASILRRYVEHTFDDVSHRTSPTLENWQLLSYATVQQDKYESCLSDFILRFGSFDSDFSKTYLALDKFCDEIVHRAGYDDVDEYANVVVCGGEPYTAAVGMNLIRIKTTDFHRFWNWGILGHELGHDITRTHFGILSRIPSERMPIRTSVLNARQVALVGNPKY